MTLPTRTDAEKILCEYVHDSYQLLHARMVATAMGGYAALLGEDVELWYITGLLHDIDFEQHPDLHPGPSLSWFKEWNYPDELINAVEVHAYGYNNFERRPETKLDAAILACDEISGIFYAYKQINPIPYAEMKVSSIKKRLKEKAFAAKIDRDTIYLGVEKLGLDLDTHIEHLIHFFSSLDK
ncbi:MAG: HD domain-containing protein [Candidatus Paceibacterota bacterium]